MYLGELCEIGKPRKMMYNNVCYVWDGIALHMGFDFSEYPDLFAMQRVIPVLQATSNQWREVTCQ